MRNIPPIIQNHYNKTRSLSYQLSQLKYPEARIYVRIDVS